MVSIGTKTLLKITAILVLALESYWVFWLGKEPHAIGVCSSITSLFGSNALHEYFNDDGKS